MKTTKPAETIEGLRTQFFALNMIKKSLEAQVLQYAKRAKEFNYDRIIQLEAELESQKEMNSILTNELNEKL